MKAVRLALMAFSLGVAISVTCYSAESSKETDKKPDKPPPDEVDSADIKEKSKDFKGNDLPPEDTDKKEKSLADQFADYLKEKMGFSSDGLAGAPNRACASMMTKLAGDFGLPITQTEYTADMLKELSGSPNWETVASNLDGKMSADDLVQAIKDAPEGTVIVTAQKTDANGNYTGPDGHTGGIVKEADPATGDPITKIASNGKIEGEGRYGLRTTGTNGTPEGWVKTAASRGLLNRIALFVPKSK